MIVAESGERQPVHRALFMVSLAVHIGLTVRFLANTAAAVDLLDVVTYLTVGLFSTALSTAKFVARRLWVYAVALTVHYLIAIPLLAFLFRYSYDPVVWTVVFLAEIFVYIGAPWNAVLGAVAILTHAVTGSVGSALWPPSYGTDGFLLGIAVQVTALVMVHGGGCLLIGYRERLVERERDNERLEMALTQLSLANVSYQELAVDLEERSVEKERQRITRDIHDVVGYTLTNNIIMMEAAVDMIRKDPLGVPRLLHSARENSEQGLAQIRAALYKLREQRVAHPEGIGAVARMVRVFQRATGLEIRLELGDRRLELPEEVSSVVYHFVQEGLINSFRHGHASRMLVMFFLADHNLVVEVWDNGTGAASPSEGIGITGMRERAAFIGATVSYENVIDGFSITLRIPKERL
ncbi:MAG: hypothetical protein EA382_05960 [Spirochaetaceae bacterium]|nr:MAG: hypothetical protein EA382_05960 [Spirochaetaceae bacterium]